MAFGDAARARALLARDVRLARDRCGTHRPSSCEGVTSRNDQHQLVLQPRFRHKSRSQRRLADHSQLDFPGRDHFLDVACVTDPEANRDIRVRREKPVQPMECQARFKHSRNPYESYTKVLIVLCYTRGDCCQGHLPQGKDVIVAGSVSQDVEAPLESVIKGEVLRMYQEVAQNPQGEFHFYHGRPAAEMLGYATEWLGCAPRAAVASFAGVGNPHVRSRLQPGEVVLDLGSGAGLDSIIA